MKKIVFWVLLIISLAAIGYFVGYPYISKQLKPILSKNEKTVELLKPEEKTTESFIQEGWVEPEVVEYQSRNIPDLEKDFYDGGYPLFQYKQNADGSLNKKSERSYHEDGMMLFLFSNDAGYLTGARIEHGVKKDKFKSTYMSENIPPLLDFIKIITNREVTEEDRNALLRLFTVLFNDPDTKNNKIRINGLDFSVTLDTMQCLIIISCGEQDPAV